VSQAPVYGESLILDKLNQTPVMFFTTLFGTNACRAVSRRVDPFHYCDAATSHIAAIQLPV
jgi:hypothetical protein